MRFSVPDGTPLFSVVIPTLNSRPAFLSQCLESVLQQTLQPSEVIIVNNGVVGVKFPRSIIPIRVIDTVFKAGVAQARNIGCTLAKSPYVVFLDDDDLLSADYLELMALRIRAEAPDCLVGRLDQLVGGEVLPYKNAHGALRENVILVRNPGITGSSVVIRKEAFLAAGGFNPMLVTGQDKALVLEMMRHKFLVISAPECQSIIRQHAGQRQTSPSNLAGGILSFYRVYKHEMKWRQKAINLLKVARYALKGKFGR